jgi:hypothetical protein
LTSDLKISITEILSANIGSYSTDLTLHVGARILDGQHTGAVLLLFHDDIFTWFKLLVIDEPEDLMY